MAMHAFNSVAPVVGDGNSETGLQGLAGQSVQL